MRSGRLSRLEVVPLPDKLTEQQAGVLLGSMLGDGCLYRHKTTHTPHLAITRSRKDLAYLQWEGAIFAPFMKREVQLQDYYDPRTSRIYERAVLVTRAVPAFDAWHKQWYDSQGVKVVPLDLELTSLAMAIWFSDDGSVSRSSKSVVAGSMKLKLATHGFSKDEVHFLCELLSVRYQGYFSPQEEGPHHHIYGGGIGLRSLIDDIDPLLPPGMERKAYWRRPEVMANPVTRNFQPQWHHRFGFLSRRDAADHKRALLLKGIRYYRELGSLGAAAAEIEIEPSTLRQWLIASGEDIGPTGRRKGDLDWEAMRQELRLEVLESPAGHIFVSENTTTALGQARGHIIGELHKEGLLRRLKMGLYEKC